MSNERKENVRYSIIIPHYNSLASLQRLLVTIPATEDIQVIVVDDNSTVDSSKLNEYMQGQKHCEFYRNDTGKQSAGACRNIGLRHAQGKWVLFADADDYFTEGFIEETDRFYDSAYEVIFFAPDSVDLHTQKASPRHRPYLKAIQAYQKNPSRKNEIMLRYKHCSPDSKMIRRDYLIQYPIDFEEVLVANDVMFSIKLAYYMKSFTTVLASIYCITRGEGTLTTTINRERFEIRRAAFVRRCRFLQEHLSKKDWRCLNLSGESHLIQAFMKDGGKDAVLETYKILKDNNIKVFSWRNFNIYKEIKKRIRNWQRKRRRNKIAQ